MNFWPFKKKQNQAPAQVETTPAIYTDIRVVMHDGTWVSCDSPLGPEGHAIWQKFYDWFESAPEDGSYILLVGNGAIGVTKKLIKYVFVHEKRK